MPVSIETGEIAIFPQISSQRILGRLTSGIGAVEQLTKEELIDFLNIEGGSGAAADVEIADLTAETWPITYDASESTAAALVFALPTLSVTPEDNVINISTLPPASAGQFLALRFALGSGTVDQVIINLGGVYSTDGDDPFGVRETAVNSHEAMLRVDYGDDGIAMWRAFWVPRTVTGGGGGQVGSEWLTPAAEATVELSTTTLTIVELPETEENEGVPLTFAIDGDVEDASPFYSMLQGDHANLVDYSFTFPGQICDPFALASGDGSGTNSCFILHLPSRYQDEEVYWIHFFLPLSGGIMTRYQVESLIAGVTPPSGTQVIELNPGNTDGYVYQNKYTWAIRLTGEATFGIVFGNPYEDDIYGSPHMLTVVDDTTGAAVINQYGLKDHDFLDVDFTGGGRWNIVPDFNFDTQEYYWLATSIAP